MFLSTTSNVPIEFLPNIGKRTAKVLRSLGVATIGQFTQLPEQLLIELFGPSIRASLTRPLVVSNVPTGTEYNTEFSAKRKLPLLKRFQLATQLVTLL